MKSLVLHIEYLLHRHDCVILPGMGAFVAEYASASIDYVSGRIIPPSRTISFNDAILHDDGLLANSIARAERVKFEEAKTILYKHLSELKDKLSRESEIQLGKLGRMVIAEDQSLQFIPRLTPAQQQTILGMPEFGFGSQSNEQELEPINSESEVTTDSGSDLQGQSSETLPPDSYLKVLSKKNYYIPVNKIFARCAASLIVIVAITLSFIVPQPSGNNHEVKASLNPAESLATGQTDIHRIESPVPQSISDPEREDTPMSAPEQEPVIVTSPSGYYLIVATFPGQEDAEQFISQRNGGEFPLQAIESNGLYRISAGHGDYQTLRAILNSSEFRAAFSEAWIWNVDKK